MQFETFCCRLDGWARMRTLTMQISLLVSEGYSLKNSANLDACNLAYIYNTLLNFSQVCLAIKLAGCLKRGLPSLGWWPLSMGSVWRKIFHWQSSGIFPPGDKLWPLPPPPPCKSHREGMRRRFSPYQILPIKCSPLLLPSSILLPREIWNSKFSTFHPPSLPPSLPRRSHGALSNGIIIWSSDF